ncbi:hypothetical protein [Azospirillum palustre]
MLTGGRRREGGARPIQGTPIQGTRPSSPKIGAGVEGAGVTTFCWKARG